MNIDDIVGYELLFSPQWDKINSWRARKNYPATQLAENLALFRDNKYPGDLVMDSHQYAHYRFADNTKLLMYSPAQHGVRELGYMALYSADDKLLAFYSERGNVFGAPDVKFIEQLVDSYDCIHTHALNNPLNIQDVRNLALSKTKVLEVWSKRASTPITTYSHVPNYIPNELNVYSTMKILFEKEITAQPLRS